MRRLDLLGRRFGRLEVTARAGVDQMRRVIWSCACACGARIERPASSLVSGDTQSCGCLRREASAARLALITARRFPRCPAA